LHDRHHFFTLNNYKEENPYSFVLNSTVQA